MRGVGRFKHSRISRKLAGRGTAFSRCAPLMRTRMRIKAQMSSTDLLRSLETVLDTTMFVSGPKRRGQCPLMGRNRTSRANDLMSVECQVRTTISPICRQRLRQRRQRTPSLAVWLDRKACSSALSELSATPSPFLERLRLRNCGYVPSRQQSAEIVLGPKI